MSPTSDNPAPQRLATKLRSVHVNLREDLEVSRHSFRGEPSYIVRDPMTFHSQRFTLADYQIFVRIDATRSLADIFKELVSGGKLRDDDEERFYRFIMSLHGLGFLHLPISDSKLLYRRYLTRQQARRREKLLGFLFLRIPLWNPDRFLDRTMHLVRPLFSPLFFVFWLLLIGSAGYVAARQWEELARPLEGVLVAGNLPLMWATLIGLKLIHEMGHAYACKHYGGHVPEIGAYLIVFTPCAYMDASASWGFVRKWERIVVCLGGMYFELMVAAVAVLVWATSDAPLLKAIAYNVIFLASTVTVLFNINPLLRYDGYYILSDLLEVPNLRQRSNRLVLGVLKRLFLGLHTPPTTGDRRLCVVLFVYGIAASFYRVFLVLAIAAILVSRMFLAGVALGIFFLGGLVLRNVRRLTGYMWYAEETAPIRRRAVALSVVVLAVVPTAVVFLPVPAHVRAAALVSREHETVVRAGTAGFLTQVVIGNGQTVTRGDSLAHLSNDHILGKIAHATAGLKASQIRRDAFLVTEPARALQEQTKVDVERKVLEDANARAADLHIRAPRAGRIVACLRDRDIGAFLVEGSPVATLVAGRWNVRAILTEDQIARARPRIGQKVLFRAASAPSSTIEGVITRIDPTGSRDIDLQPLTHPGGGDIAVDPLTREAAQPYFEVIITLPQDSTGAEPDDRTMTQLRHGMTGSVRFRAAAEPIARSLGRRFIRFWNRLQQS